MALSNAKIEYRVITPTTSELVCIKQLLEDLGIQTSSSIKKISLIKLQDILHRIKCFTRELIF
jgi:hypothetical protein